MSPTENRVYSPNRAKAIVQEKKWIQTCIMSATYSGAEAIATIY